MDTPFFDDVRTVRDYFEYVATLFEEPYTAPRLTAYGPTISLCLNCGGRGCAYCAPTEPLPVPPNPNDQERWGDILPSPITEA